MNKGQEMRNDINAESTLFRHIMRMTNEWIQMDAVNPKNIK